MLKLFKSKSPKKRVKNIEWLTVVIFFLIGVLLVTNTFLFFTDLSKQKEIRKLNKEIMMLKKDDNALAQAYNKLILDLKARGVILSSED